MNAKNELAPLVEEMRKCGETLIGMSERLDALFSKVEEKPSAKKSAPKKKATEEPKPTPTLEDVRAICADKSRQGFTAGVKAILTKHGADKLSEVAPEKYEALLAEVEALGNDS